MKILLIGGFPEIIELCEDLDYKIEGIIDTSVEKKILGYDVIGHDDDAKRIFNQYKNTPAVISPDLPQIRKKLINYYSAIGFSFQSLVSAKATISKYAIIGDGVIIHHGCNVSAMSRIGNYVRLNVNTNIMHDCMIGEFSTAAPNSVLLGYVQVDECVYIGSNATILPKLSIGANAIIGAGAVVTKSVIPNVTVKGVPAK